jgi:hypothetical protein
MRLTVPAHLTSRRSDKRKQGTITLSTARSFPILVSLLAIAQEQVDVNYQLTNLIGPRKNEHDVGASM